eukprot:3382426-Alexandrium_andersonii.AAC.1
MLFHLLVPTATLPPRWSRDPLFRLHLLVATAATPHHAGSAPRFQDSSAHLRRGAPAVLVP